MKKLLLTTALASSVLLLTACNKEETNTLTFATEATYAPFESVDSKGNLEGFDIDLANALCEKLHKQCVFKNIAFDSLIPGLKANKFDAAIGAIGVTEDRKKQVLFTDVYMDNTSSFVGLKGKADLSNAKTIAVQNGTTYQNYLVKTSPQYSIKPHASLQNAFLDLKNGRVDLIFADTPVLSEWLKTESDLQFVGQPITDKSFFGEGSGIAVNKNNKALVDQLNKALKELKESGEMQKIYHKWIAQ